MLHSDVAGLLQAVYENISALAPERRIASYFDGYSQRSSRSAQYTGGVIVVHGEGAGCF
ncbi:MAG: hypothetical protein HY028_00830 [Gammaproteobacteria bacterium]|nr:hypothetical protein [Gammaproteobacteria bacterium]